MKKDFAAENKRKQMQEWIDAKDDAVNSEIASGKSC